MRDAPSRRRYIATVAAGTVAGLAGCDGSGDGSPTTTDDGTAPTNGDGTPTTTADDPRHLVGAHYYTWYGSDPEAWSERTVRTPTLGDYDSDDGSVIDQHLDWSLDHGIGWWSVTWWGPDSDSVLAGPISEADRIDEIRLSILYETAGRLNASDLDLDQSGARERLRSDLEYLDETYFGRDNYRRIDGRPVLFVYAAQYLTGDVAGAFEAATADLDTDPYILADVGFGSSPADSPIVDVADGLTAYNPYTPREDIEDVFHDRYERGSKTLQLGAEFSDCDFVPVVIPGFNNTGYPQSEREDVPVLSATPERYQRVCEQVRPHLADGKGVLVTSFNEWHETTQVEPSEKYGTAYLERTRDALANAESSGYDPTGRQITLDFNRTAVPAEVDESSGDTRELAFMAVRIDLRAGGDSVGTYDVGTEGSGLLWLQGAHGREWDDEGQYWRWLGARPAQATVFVPDVERVDEGTLHGRPMVSGIEADVRVDGERTDHVAFGERGGVTEYDVSLSTE